MMVVHRALASLASDAHINKFISAQCPGVLLVYCFRNLQVVKENYILKSNILMYKEKLSQESNLLFEVKFFEASKTWFGHQDIWYSEFRTFTNEPERVYLFVANDTSVMHYMIV